ncbi:MAG: hypothetical protein KKD69_00845, partial [Euryarchaeota archaeon]|nr:hypothetical protein [Euryarchaeota archaeon]
ETAIANKVDLPFIGYCDLIGAKKILHNTVQINDRIWIDFIRDIKAIRQENLRGKYGKIKMLEKMLKDFGPNTVFSFFAKDDLKPFLMYLFDRFLAVFRKIIFFYRPLRSSRKVRKGKIGFPFC